MSASPRPARSVVWLFAAVCLAALALYGRALLFPVLVQDDFQILAQSWTWPRTVDGLWTPNNEHAMPLGRLLTFAVGWLTPQPADLPFAAVQVGVLGLVLTIALTYWFVRRELGHPLYGLTAMILFGHGVAITGSSLATTVSNSYFLNMNARIQMDAIRIGGGSVSYLEREPGAKAPVATPAGAGANNRAWEYWKRRVAAEVGR